MSHSSSLMELPPHSRPQIKGEYFHWFFLSCVHCLSKDVIGSCCLLLLSVLIAFLIYSIAEMSKSCWSCQSFRMILKILSVRTTKNAAKILLFCQSEWNFVSQIHRSDTFRHCCCFKTIRQILLCWYYVCCLFWSWSVQEFFPSYLLILWCCEHCYVCVFRVFFFRRHPLTRYYPCHIAQFLHVPLLGCCLCLGSQLCSIVPLILLHAPLHFLMCYCHSAPSVRPSVSVVRKRSHFQLLLQNRLMDFDETW